MNVFVNGKLVERVTNSPLITMSSNKMYLGYNFIGVLDEVAIYSSPLTQTEIQNQLTKLSLRIIFFSFIIFFLIALKNHFKTFFFLSFFLSFSFLATSKCQGCLNGGICGKVGGGKVCFCPQCFSGPKCATTIKGCLNPCQNGGKYVGGVCQCAAGFTDPTCSSCIFLFSFFSFSFSFFLKKTTNSINSINYSYDMQCNQ